MEDNREKKEMRKRRVTFKSTAARAIKIGKLNPDSFFWYLYRNGAKVVLTMNHLQCWKKLAITNALEVKRKSNICYNSQLGNWREFGKTLSRAFSHQGFSTKLNFDDLGYPKWKDIPLSLNGKVLLLLRKLQNWQNCIKMSKRTKNHATDNFLIFFIFLQFLN